MIIFGTVLLYGPWIVGKSLISGNYALPFQVAGRFCIRLMLYFGVRVRISGKDNILPDNAYLILSNHQSFLDVPVILYLKPLGFVAKQEISKWPLFGAAMKRMHCIFVDRSNPLSRAQVGPQMQKHIQKKVSYCVYPEGTRSPDGKLLPFRLGVFRIAMESNLEILPVTMCDSYKILPKHSFKFTPGTIHCVIHQSIQPAGFTSPEDLLNAVRKIISCPLDENLKVPQ